MIKNREMIELCDALNLTKLMLVDVGAAGGFDPKWDSLGNRLFVIGFEPGQEEFEELSATIDKDKVKYYNYCLAESPRQVNFFVSKSNKNASCLEPNYEFLKRFPLIERFDLLDKISLKADSLDNTPLAEKADFIKVDTEGYELNILKGGIRVLENVCGLEVEVEFVPLHKGQPLFSDVDLYLREFGFRLFDLRPAYWRRNSRLNVGRGQIIFADALYFKDYIALDSVPVFIGPSILTAAVYKKYDYALELLDYFYIKGRIGKDDKRIVESIIMNLSKPALRFPDFKGRQKAISCLQKVLNALKSVHWARYESWE